MRFHVGVPILALVGACKPLASSEPGSIEPRADFELSGPDERERHVSWAARANLIACRHYAEPERGDYLWIRLAETPEQDGDAGVRLDIDVCRLGDVTGSVPSMPAGQHGSHCAAVPGFAIWWHEGEVAFNTGLAADPDACSLTLDYDPMTRVLRGAFACAPLVQAEPKTKTGPELSLAAGSFACEVVATSPSP